MPNGGIPGSVIPGKICGDSNNRLGTLTSLIFVQACCCLKFATTLILCGPRLRRAAHVVCCASAVDLPAGHLGAVQGPAHVRCETLTLWRGRQRATGGWTGAFSMCEELHGNLQGLRAPGVALGQRDVLWVLASAALHSMLEAFDINSLAALGRVVVACKCWYK